MNLILFGGFIILVIENRLKPRLFKTIYGDWIIWYTWKNKRKFYMIWKN